MIVVLKLLIELSRPERLTVLPQVDRADGTLFWKQNLLSDSFEVSAKVSEVPVGALRLGPIPFAMKFSPGWPAWLTAPTAHNEIKQVQALHQRLTVPRA